jgi:CMP-N,N'-diacetyllegionaminic acid synthase
MINNKKILAVIPARSASKRLPNKNILDLAGKPLIAWTIDAALKSNFVDKVIVSSDSEQILNISKDYGADTIKRPSYLANDSATTYDVINHTIQNEDKYDYVVVLQPTSPLRKNKHIDEALKLLIDKNADSIISVCETDHNPQWINTLPNDSSMNLFLSDELKNKRSQDLEQYYQLNGAIYICNINKLANNNSFFFEKQSFAYVMAPEESIDIDTIRDFLVAKLIIDSDL